ncbi:MAG: DUF5683 domain-containing protein [Candidatus Cloacimonadaceae bacterium]|nr:DUF5683 domain-containing protein [Candidatus Cloacimonadota bacterium]MDY0126966.1 DUF5683 domain-containing protein [Candidatus Cloacimonadaceae bacterium]
MIIPLLWVTALMAANPTHAMLYSAFIPGGGQVYNKAYVKAAVVVGLQSYLIGTAVYHDSKVQDFKDKASSSSDVYLTEYYRQRADEYQQKRTSDIWWIGITAALSVIDAYVDAHLADFESQKSKLRLRFEDEKIAIQIRF